MKVKHLAGSTALFVGLAGLGVIGCQAAPTTSEGDILQAELAMEGCQTACAQCSAGCACVGEKFGAFDRIDGMWTLRDCDAAGPTESTFKYGQSAFLPVMGDWDGDGTDTVGVYNATTATFHLRNQNSAGLGEITFGFGEPATSWMDWRLWIPIAGDWDDDGIDTIGLYNSATSTFYLRNTNTAGYADISFQYGGENSNWWPVAGDWDGDGVDTIGLYDYNNSVFHLRNHNSAGSADLVYMYGRAPSTWRPMAGDWDGDGIDTIGLFDMLGGTVYLRNEHAAGPADLTIAFEGVYSDFPVAGRW